VHKDSQAAAAAKDLKAKAFTTGKDVFFGAGQYSPATTQGKKLLAHELTHVIQQTADTQVPRMQLKKQTRKPAKPTKTVFEKIKWKTYKVDARTLAKAAKMMGERNEAGETTWNFPADWETDADGKIIKATVNVRITVTMPGWPGLKNQSKAVRKEWRRFWKALREHELGHVNIAKEKLKNFADNLQGLTEEEAKNILKHKKKELQDASDAYDAKTDHGRKEGTEINVDVE
jgi:predicted secreted Zn-dependent protease